MCKKLLSINHHLCSGCCMWSGIEDVYATQTHLILPEAFFFALASFGEAVFLKFNTPDRPFMFGLADGRTRKTYDRLKDLLGLTYQISEGRTLTYALKSTKQEIDSGHPVILGPLDMFYLPYLKMYQKDHIPMHYVLMVGYDEEKNCVLIYDCDRQNLQELPFSLLKAAWQIEKNAVGDKNGFIRFRLSQNPLSLYELADTGLLQKAQRQLCTKPSFVGINAYYKIAKEFSAWKNEFSKADYQKALISLTEFLGTVPKVPNKLLGSAQAEDICYQGNFNRLGHVLLQLGTSYQRPDWLQAGSLFLKCGCYIEQITNHIIAFCCNEKDNLSEIPHLFIETGDLASKAYHCILTTKGGQ